jgi:transposase
LYLAFELGWNEWKLAFATAAADNPRLRSLGGRNTQALLEEIAKAKKRFGLPDDAPVQSCYEAGRDGFWLHRFLEHQGLPIRSSIRPASRSNARGGARRPIASTPGNC